MTKEDFYRMDIKPGDVLTTLSARANYSGSFLTLADMPGSAAPAVVLLHGDILLFVPLILVNSIHILEKKEL